MERTPHGKERREDEERPTSEAAKDKAAATEIYIDAKTGYYIFVGNNGRTHIFTAENYIIQVFGQPERIALSVK